MTILGGFHAANYEVISGRITGGDSGGSLKKLRSLLGNH